MVLLLRRGACCNGTRFHACTVRLAAAGQSCACALNRPGLLPSNPLSYLQLYWSCHETVLGRAGLMHALPAEAMHVVPPMHGLQALTKALKA